MSNPLHPATHTPGPPQHQYKSKTKYGWSQNFPLIKFIMQTVAGVSGITVCPLEVAASAHSNPGRSRLGKAVWHWYLNPKEASAETPACGLACLQYQDASSPTVACGSDCSTVQKIRVITPCEENLHNYQSPGCKFCRHINSSRSLSALAHLMASNP